MLTKWQWCLLPLVPFHRPSLLKTCEYRGAGEVNPRVTPPFPVYHPAQPRWGWWTDGASQYVLIFLGQPRLISGLDDTPLLHCQVKQREENCLGATSEVEDLFANWVNSWPLNNTGLNCLCPLIRGYFSVVKYCSWYYTICGWLNPQCRGTMVTDGWL